MECGQSSNVRLQFSFPIVCKANGNFPQPHELISRKMDLGLQSPVVKFAVNTRRRQLLCWTSEVRTLCLFAVPTSHKRLSLSSPPKEFAEQIADIVFIPSEEIYLVIHGKTVSVAQSRLEGLRRLPDIETSTIIAAAYNALRGELVTVSDGGVKVFTVGNMTTGEAISNAEAEQPENVTCTLRYHIDTKLRRSGKLIVDEENSLILYAFRDSVISWNQIDGSLHKKLYYLHSGDITGIAPCHDHKYPSEDLIVTSSKDCTVKMWSIKKPSTTRASTCLGHDTSVTSILVDIEQQCVLTTSVDGTIRCFPSSLGPEAVLDAAHPDVIFEMDRLVNASEPPTPGRLGTGPKDCEFYGIEPPPPREYDDILPLASFILEHEENNLRQYIVLSARYCFAFELRDYPIREAQSTTKAGYSALVLARTKLGKEGGHDPTARELNNWGNPKGDGIFAISRSITDRKGAKAKSPYGIQFFDGGYRNITFSSDSSRLSAGNPGSCPSVSVNPKFAWFNNEISRMASEEEILRSLIVGHDSNYIQRFDFHKHVRSSALEATPHTVPDSLQGQSFRALDEVTALAVMYTKKTSEGAREGEHNGLEPVIVVGTRLGIISFYSYQELQCLKTEQCHQGAVVALLCLDEDLKMGKCGSLLSVEDSSIMLFWDLGKRVITDDLSTVLESRVENMVTCGMLRNERILILGMQSGDIEMWSIPASQLHRRYVRISHTVRNHTKAITTIRKFPEIWDEAAMARESAKREKEAEEERAKIAAIADKSNSSPAGTPSRSQSHQLLRRRSSILAMTTTDEEEVDEDVDDALAFYSGSEDGTAILWKRDGPSYIPMFTFSFDEPVFDVVYLPGLSYFIVALKDSLERIPFSTEPKPSAEKIREERRRALTTTPKPYPSVTPSPTRSTTATGNTSSPSPSPPRRTSVNRSSKRRSSTRPTSQTHGLAAFMQRSPTPEGDIAHAAKGIMDMTTNEHRQPSKQSSWHGEHGADNLASWDATPPSSPDPGEEVGTKGARNNFSASSPSPTSVHNPTASSRSRVPIRTTVKNGIITAKLGPQNPNAPVFKVHGQASPPPSPPTKSPQRQRRLSKLQQQSPSPEPKHSDVDPPMSLKVMLLRKNPKEHKVRVPTTTPPPPVEDEAQQNVTRRRQRNKFVFQ